MGQRGDRRGSALTGPEIRRIALDRALEDFGVWFAKWCDDEMTNDIDNLDDLACYTKDD